MRSIGRYMYPVRAAMSDTISHPDRSLWWRIPGTEGGIGHLLRPALPGDLRELMKKGAS